MFYPNTSGFAWIGTTSSISNATFLINTASYTSASPYIFYTNYSQSLYHTQSFTSVSPIFTYQSIDDQSYQQSVYNSFASDLDYSNGVTPTNFSSVISGTAAPATVPDSNYTSKKSTLLKYEGSKSTSQFLNQWTEGDTGTYGKLPTIESLKTYIAYCDNDTFGGISGWPPEHEDASAMFVKYLIKADGTVIIPNTSKDSLSIMQQTFLTGERVIVSSAGGTPVNPYRTIIRGGSHIEPILYSQFGQLPNVTWNTTMSFEDIDLNNGNAVTADYGAIYGVNPTGVLANSANYIFTNGVLQTFPWDTTIYGSGWGSNYTFAIPPTSVSQGVNFTFKLSFSIPLPQGNTNITSVKAELARTTPPSSASPTIYTTTQNVVGPSYANAIGNFNFSTTINNADLATGQLYRWFVTITYLNNQPPVTKRITNPNFQITQFPSYLTPVTSSGYNTIWGYGDKSTYPYIITSSQPTLASPTLYGNPEIRAKSITGSGFNTIQVPWEIKIGDEFKFEGREDWSFMVKSIYSPSDSGDGRIFQTGSIEVHFNANLPVSASSSVFNLDHFLIRRYVDDAGQNVITGFKPQGSTSPYLIKPEFVVPELNKNIDEVILDLTQKGLIT
jgi:hypothetical protein